jgi:hypothetical protein
MDDEVKDALVEEDYSDSKRKKGMNKNDLLIGHIQS